MKHMGKLKLVATLIWQNPARVGNANLKSLLNVLEVEQAIGELCDDQSTFNRAEAGKR